MARKKKTGHYDYLMSYETTLTYITPAVCEWVAEPDVPQVPFRQTYPTTIVTPYVKEPRMQRSRRKNKR